MKKLLILALALFATPAMATTYYVSPAARGGSDSNPGTDSTAALGTIERGLQLAQPGDKVKVLGGNYAEGITSVRNGAPGAYITVEGDCATPGNVILTGPSSGNHTIHHEYISWRGFKTTKPNTGFSWGNNPREEDRAPYKAARNDSLTWCEFAPTDSGGTVSFGGSTSHITGLHVPGYRKSINNVMYGNRFVMREVFCGVSADAPYCDNMGCDDSSRTRFNTYRKNTFVLRKGGSVAIWRLLGFQQNVVDSNTITLIWQEPNSGATGWHKASMHSFNTYRDNYWRYEDRRGGVGPTYHAYQRDSSGHNSWTRDTIDLNTPLIYFQLPGTTYGNDRGSGGQALAGHNAMKDCLVRNRFPGGNGINFQLNMNSDTLLRTTIATGGQPITFIAGLEGDNVIEHCTLVDSVSGAGWIFGPSAQNTWTGTMKFKSNLLYSKDKLGTDRAPIRFKLPRANPLDSDFNFYVMYDSTAVFGDRSLSYLTTEADGSQASAVFYSRPDSIPWRSLTWGLFVANDINSRLTGRAKGSTSVAKDGKAGPKFVDSLLATFDPTLGSGSGALTVGEGGSDAGAKQLTTADATRPDDPQDVYVATLPLPEAVNLDFTATGDDSLTSRAHHYEVRYAEETITAGNFDDPLITTAFSTPQTPVLPLAIERITVTGLRPTTDYYFAIKVVDDAGNKSAISNVVAARTGGAGGGINLIDP